MKILLVHSLSFKKFHKFCYIAPFKKVLNFPAKPQNKFPPCDAKKKQETQLRAEK